MPTDIQPDVAAYYRAYNAFSDPGILGARYADLPTDPVLLASGRMRCGSADYFDAQHGDHVVTEYWDPQHGWRSADPQIADPRIASAFAVDFDPMDVPRHRFLVAGAAWQAIRTGGADPLTFGHWSRCAREVAERVHCPTICSRALG